MADDRDREPGGAANLNTMAAARPREGVPNDPREMRDPETAGGAGGLRPADPAAERAADRTALEGTELTEGAEDVPPPGVETAGASGNMPVGPGEDAPAGGAGRRPTG